ncbi:hypothetical protein ACR6C2_35255 [Streptomyces sp. INA 01156]
MIAEAATGLPTLLFTAALVVAACFWLLVAVGVTTPHAFDSDADLEAWGWAGCRSLSRSPCWPCSPGCWPPARPCCWPSTSPTGPPRGRCACRSCSPRCSPPGG